MAVGLASPGQVEEFGYLGVVFTSEGNIICKINRQICAASAVIRLLYDYVAVKKEEKLLIYWPICYYPHLWSWAFVHDHRKKIADTCGQMSFLQRVTLRVGNKVRNSDAGEELNEEPLHLHI